MNTYVFTVVPSGQELSYQPRIICTQVPVAIEKCVDEIDKEKLYGGPDFILGLPKNPTRGDWAYVILRTWLETRGEVCKGSTIVNRHVSKVVALKEWCSVPMIESVDEVPQDMRDLLPGEDLFENWDQDYAAALCRQRSKKKNCGDLFSLWN